MLFCFFKAFITLFKLENCSVSKIWHLSSGDDIATELYVCLIGNVGWRQNISYSCVNLVESCCNVIVGKHTAANMGQTL